MRIEGLEVTNVLGIAHLELSDLPPVLLLAGGNASGKSSLCESIRMALTGRVDRVKLKRDYPALVHDGAKKGEIRLIGEGGEIIGAITLPKGERVTSAPPGPLADYDFLPLVLDVDGFAALSVAERRAALFALAGCSTNREAVLAELASAGCDAAKLEVVAPLLRSGFPAACDAAKEQMSQARGAWQQITGETYGSEKAETWAPEVVDLPPRLDERLGELRTERDALRVSLEDAIAALARARLLGEQAEGLDVERQRLVEQAESLPRAEKKAEVDRGQLNEWRARLEDLRRQQDQAGNNHPADCPACGARLAIVEGKRLVPADSVSGNVSPGRRFAEELATVERTVAMLERTHQNDIEAVAAARAAQQRLDELRTVEPATVDLGALDVEVSDLRYCLSKAEDAVTLAEQQLAYQSGAANAQADAFAVHQDIMAWGRIADEFGPEGYPARLVTRALAPINRELKALANVAQWAVPALSTEMEITLGGRLFGLLSESEKWRAKALVLLAIAKLSGLKLAILDRLDVIQPSERQNLLGLGVILGDSGQLDTLVTACTMKAKPGPMPPSVKAIWLEDGSAE